jgi:hypothetical protein
MIKVFKNKLIYNYINNHQYRNCVFKYIPNSLAVIIETRPVDTLNWTINNILKYSKFPVRIYHSKENEQLLPDNIEKIKINSINIVEYNKLLTSRKFWEELPAENILIFQSDSFMLRDGIEEFINYDYIGADWYWIYLNQYPEYKKYSAGGNGGFSFRKKSKMLEIIDRLPYDDKLNEDMYFALGLQGTNLPTPEQKQKFSVESVFHKEPLAVHAPDKYMKDDQLKIILGL